MDDRQRIPAHVMANILGRLHLHDTMRVAHTCHAFHALIFDTPTCQCAKVAASGADGLCARMYASAFWTHWRTCAPKRSEAMVACARRGHLACVAAVVLADPSIDQDMALIEASARGHVGVVRVLLHHARVNVAAHRHRAIARAMAKGHLGVVQLLLDDPRADRYALDRWEVALAARKGHANVLRHVLERPGLVNDTNRDWVFPTALHEACWSNRTDVVRLFASDPRFDVTDFTESMASAAMYRHNTEITEMLFRDPRPDAPIVHPNQLVYACAGSDLWMVDRLLRDERTDPSFGDFQAFRTAARNGNVAIVKRFFEHPTCGTVACARLALRDALRRQDFALQRACRQQLKRLNATE